MFAEAIEDILRDNCSPAVVRAIEAGDSPAALWDTLASSGFLELLAPENSGGAGLPLAELFPVLALFGRYTVPAPVAQAIVARALVGEGVQLPLGMLTIAPALNRDAAGGIRCPLVPFGAIAEFVLAADGNRLVLLPGAQARRTPSGIAHSQLASFYWSDPAAAEPIAGDAAALAPLAAAMQAALLAGALTRVFEMTLQYCNERSQFGKSLGRFQAVQHQLSVMAEQVAAASIAAEAAFQAEGRTPRLLPAAMAKSRTSEAAPWVANTAHALHGAIGVTEEFDLQLFTRRLHEWRLAYGGESHWHCIVGKHLLAANGTLAEFVRAA